MKLSKHQHDYLLNWLQEQLELVNEEIAERKGEGRQILESGLRKLAKEGTR